MGNKPEKGKAPTQDEILSTIGELKGGLDQLESQGMWIIDRLSQNSFEDKENIKLCNIYNTWHYFQLSYPLKRIK